MPYGESESILTLRRIQSKDLACFLVAKRNKSGEVMSHINEKLEEEKDKLRSAANSRISQYCNYAALVIILISLATFVLGHFDSFFIQVGTMISIALLAIAAINNPTRK